MEATLYGLVGTLTAALVIGFVTLAIQRPHSYNRALNILAACLLVSGLAYGFYALGSHHGAEYALEAIRSGGDQDAAMPLFSRLPLVVGVAVFFVAFLIPVLVAYLDLNGNTQKPQDKHDA